MRKLLYDYLANAHDHQITSIVASLQYSSPPSSVNLFRQFKLGEVITVIRRLFLDPNATEDEPRNIDKTFKLATEA